MTAALFLLATQKERPALDLQLLAPHRPVVAGQKTDLTIRVTNRTSKNVMVVPPGDFGFCDLRSPVCKLECRLKGSDKWIDASLHPDCGNTDPINLRDFAPIKPGQSMEWHGLLRWERGLDAYFKKNPGRYEFRLTYTTAAAIDVWIGGPIPEPAEAKKQEIQAAFDQVPKGVFESRTAILDIRQS